MYSKSLLIGLSAFVTKKHIHNLIRTIIYTVSNTVNENKRRWPP